MPLDAGRIARDLFHISATATRLPGEFDDNFHLLAGNAEYLLKIMRLDCAPGFVDMQIRALHHLRDFPVPHPAADVKTFEGRIVWLLHWLPGRMLADVHQTPEMLRNLGRLLGQIDRALESFSHVYARREFKWNLEGSAWIEDFFRYIPDPARRKTVGAILDQFKDAKPFARVRRGVIHGDANTHNVLVEGDTITGLIDFGDLHESAPAAELAVACAYAALGKKDPREAIENVKRGFEEAFPLTGEEANLLNLLILTRLAVSVTNSAYMKTISSDPYASVSETQAWEVLEAVRC